MKAADFSKYIADPSVMGPEAVGELSKLVGQFPYFQPAHILLTLAARKWDAALYQECLKRTAIVVTNRGRLFELLSAMDETPVISGESAPAPEVNVAAPSPAQRNEVVNDLVLLKAAEQKADEPVVSAEAKSETPGIEKLEEEISRQVVTSFVEKEVLKTPEAQKPTKPAPVDKPASFGDWLAYMKKNNGQSWEQLEEEVKKDRQDKEEPAKPPAPDRRKRNQAIIDSIIEKNPGQIRAKEEARFFTPESRAKESLLENEHLVTETLARIYALQGNTGKAIRAYQILSLKNPQKSAYFAGLIENLKNNSKTE
jgi:hypothetical protein